MTEKISIHALREEGDPFIQNNLLERGISIHALREEGDDEKTGDLSEAKEFLSTPSARRATDIQACKNSRHNNFYPRPPRGGRLTNRPKSTAIWKFLSTPSARRATFRMLLNSALISLFLSTPSARRATQQSGCKQ